MCFTVKLTFNINNITWLIGKKSSLVSIVCNSWQKIISLITYFPLDLAITRSLTALSSNTSAAGGLTTSQFPVFTIYIQKMCLPTAPCSRAWTFESVEGYAMDQHAKKRGRLPTRENCMALCRSEKEFTCRWEIRERRICLHPGADPRYESHGSPYCPV